ncbi:polysaccharide biosynthesis tyrosine autokinase [Bifidobacterium crudilactis]|uniref:polysaccharide biosynthesis tyrosine autokinase n=1 Tax=Bifidobacterium crudilactis TaxID=327277 RepID=UPI002357067A|nr:polysaccharide biosynthesis tyrosine autokinase [Bifidobacterium crudilactis]
MIPESSSDNYEDVANHIEKESAGSNTTVVELFQTIRKHKVLVVVFFLVIIAATCIYTFASSPRYTASSELFASYDDASSSSQDISSINTAGSYIATQIKSYPSLATTQAVLDPVIKDLNLDMSVKDLGELITVTNPTNTMLVDISVETDDAAQSQKIANAVAESLSDTVKSSLYSSSNSPVKLAVVQKATLPESPSSPNIKLNLLIGIVLGIIVGILAALVRDMTDTRLSSVRDLQGITNAPLLGSIPSNDAVKKTASVIASAPSSLVAEEYRRVRSNLSFIAPVEGLNSRLIVVTSTEPGEGKTTTSVNVAAAFAENGSRVLLIDADLRHPSVAEKVGVEGAVGLSHVLSGQANVADVVQRYWKANLHVMPAGPKPPNASILLNSTTMEAMVAQALKQYDYVIIDTTPMTIAADAGMFGRMGNGVIMVVGRGVCDKKDLSSTLSQLKNVEVPVIGTVLNYAEQSKKHHGNYYYYDTEGKRQQRHTS